MLMINTQNVKIARQGGKLGQKRFYDTVGN